MKIKSIIFDLDGTLLDSMQCWENVDRCFLRENGVEPPEGISDTVKKMTINDAAMYFKTRFSLKQSCEEIRDRIEEMVRERYAFTIPLKNGAYETVAKLKKAGYRMCVATATYSRLANSALKRLGLLEYFDFILTCSDIGAGKDSPDIFLKSAEKMGCSVENTVVVEDSLHCIESAASAGFRTVAVYDKISDGEWSEICRKSWKNVTELTEIISILGEEN